MRSLPEFDGAGNVPLSLDLVPVELLRPRARKIAAAAIGAGVVVGLLVWIVAPTWAALLVGGLIALPPAVGATAATRRHLRLDGLVITMHGMLRSRSVDLTRVAGVELLVRTTGMSQVILRINDGEHRLVVVPLALYANGGGRELDILALRKLADALDAGELASAAAISSVLVEQLRAEARGAALDERPLYRAAQLVREAGRTPQTTLTDREVASLVD